MSGSGKCYVCRLYWFECQCPHGQGRIAEAVRMTTPINPAATQGKGASAEADRAGRASPEPASSLGHTATIPCAFTPGPWAVRKNEYGDLVVDPMEVCVANVGRGPLGEPAVANFGHEQGPRVEADARLIAAAPELYEAVEDLAERMIGAFPSLADTPEIQRAKAALAKARGEA